jgi:hypothetical protein
MNRQATVWEKIFESKYLRKVFYPEYMKNVQISMLRKHSSKKGGRL